MDISVILCTYNRSRDLAKALDSLVASRMGESVEWEVLIVDNRSQDDTRHVAETFVARHGGRCRYIFEDRQGKSYALNAGIREARGNVLAFMDDDVTVDSNWLYYLTNPVLAGKWAGAAGRVFPARDVVLPIWATRNSRFIVGPLVIFDLGPEPMPLRELPFGTNMAFRKAVFQKYGHFRTDLGPQPGSEIRGEDSELVLRLFAAGEPLLYQPSAVVYHAVPEDRLTKRYFLAWWFDKGRSEVRTVGSSTASGLSVAGVPLAMIRRVTVWLFKWLLGRGPSQRFEARLTAWYLLGKVAELYRERRNTKSGSSLSRKYSGGLSANTGFEQKEGLNSVR